VVVFVVTDAATTSGYMRVMVPGFVSVCFFPILVLDFSYLVSGPNELSVNLPSAIRPIYAQMFRAPAYQGLKSEVFQTLSDELSFTLLLAAPQDADALITTTDRAEHASRLIVSVNQIFGLHVS
jgi:hypothetical protein